MRLFDLGEVIAERRFVFEAEDGSTRDVGVRLGRPVRDGEAEDDPWMCPFQIDGLGSGGVKGIFGVDALQALTLAMHTIPVELACSMRNKRGRLLSFGEPDTTFLSGCRTAIECAGDAFPPKESEPPRE